MENKIYRRQIVKQSMSHRVVDEQQIVRHFKKNDLEELYEFETPDEESIKQPGVPTDLLLANMIEEHGKWIVSYHEQDSLLENQPEEDLSEEERKAAWAEYDRLMTGIEKERTEIDITKKIEDASLKMIATEEMPKQQNTFQPVRQYSSLISQFGQHHQTSTSQVLPQHQLLISQSVSQYPQVQK